MTSRRQWLGLLLLGLASTAALVAAVALFFSLIVRSCAC